MRYAFIVNPRAGKHNPAEWFMPQVRAWFDARGLDYSVQLTEYPGHAAELARAAGAAGDEVRVIAVGGDGTLCEAANGAMHLPNVAVGVLPCGSGNDYLKMFGTRADFIDLERLVNGTAYPVDMIENNRVPALNICCAGLDASVALNMARYKQLPLVTGATAYNIALFKAFCGKMGNPMRIWVNGELVADGTFLLSVFANGRCYGGGYFASPKSLIDDGVLDVLLVRVPKSRLQIPGLVAVYKAGHHLDSAKFNDLLTVFHGQQVSFEAKHPVAVTADGECFEIDRMDFSVLPHAVRFLVPQGCRTECLQAAQEATVS